MTRWGWVLLTPESTLLPLTRLDKSCWLGSCCMKIPSVTGRKPHVPKRLLPETYALAFCSVSVSLATRQLKMDAEALPWGRALVKQPACEAKA